ncbi:MAG: cyclase family protein [Oscillospiraceae bacterium]|nr:cyclase family protein [Oscillospiraceae bacterium]
MAKIIDITRTLQDAPIYPGSSPAKIESVLSMSNGDRCNVSMITAGSHMGTHADASSHFLKDSMTSIDLMPLAHYYGPCRVLTVDESAMITQKMLKGKLDGCERLVIHGGGLSYLTKEAAEYIVNTGVITIVTDALSVAPPDNEVEIHSIILSAGIAVVENTILDNVDDGEYILSAFPVKIGGCDGAPVRAVLIQIPD